jgi:hypothetical protein
MVIRQTNPSYLKASRKERSRKLDYYEREMVGTELAGYVPPPPYSPDPNRTSGNVGSTSCRHPSHPAWSKKASWAMTQAR